jgi:TctA family transporter
MLTAHLKIISSVSLLTVIVGLFQISLAIKTSKNLSEQSKKPERQIAAFDYRYLRGGMFLILLACLVQYFILLFSF